MSRYTRKFLHIEQHPDSSGSSDDDYRQAGNWGTAIKQTFPPIKTAKPTTGISFQHRQRPTTSYSATKDAWIDEEESGQPVPDSFHGEDETCEVDGAAGEEKSALLWWDISILPRDVIVEHATVSLHVTDATNSDGHEVFELLRQWSENSVWWDATGDGLGWETPGAKGALDRSATSIGFLAPRIEGETYTFSISPAVVNNTFFHNDTDNTGSGELLIQHHVHTNVVKNNIFHALSGRYLIGNASRSVMSNQIDHNLYFTPTGEKESLWLWHGIPYTSFSAYKAGSSNDKNGRFGDPLFANAAGLDFHLGAMSPAVDAGENTGLSGTLVCLQALILGLTLQREPHFTR